MSNIVRNDAPHTNILAEAWPRLVAWLDGLSPGDLSFSAQFPHSMRVEEYVKDGRYVVRAELPGFDPDKEIRVQVDGRQLIVEAEREEKKEEGQRSEFSYGRFVRSTTLPSTVEQDSIKAEYHDGILEVSFNVKESPTDARTIPVQRVS